MKDATVRLLVLILTIWIATPVHVLADDSPPPVSLLGENAEATSAENGSPSDEEIDRDGVSDAAKKLLERYENADRCLDKVMAVRNGAKGAREEIEAILGPVSDTRLRDLDHYYQAYITTEPNIEEDDWKITRFGKRAGASVIALGASAIVGGYTAVKYVDQKTGWDLGEKFDQDFNNPNCSKASWGEIWYGLKGTWAGAFKGGS